MKRGDEDTTACGSDDDHGGNQDDEIGGKGPTPLEHGERLQASQRPQAQKDETDGHEDATKETERDPPSDSAKWLDGLLTRIGAHHVDELAERGSLGCGRGTHPFIQPARIEPWTPYGATSAALGESDAVPIAFARAFQMGR